MFCFDEIETTILNKPSGVISMKNDLTLVQKRFYNMFLFIAQEELKKNPNQTSFKVRLCDIKRFLEMTKSRNNVEIRESLKQLTEQIVESNITKKDKTIKWEVFSLLPMIRIEYGLITFEIPSVIRESILNNKSCYAKIDLKKLKKIKTKHALTLYELIKDYENVKVPKISIEDLRKIFGIENKYDYFYDIKKKVLEPAIKELNENKDIEFYISYTPIKSGIKTIAVKFEKDFKPEYKKKNKSAKQNKKTNLNKNTYSETNLKIIPAQEINLKPKSNKSSNCIKDKNEKVLKLLNLISKQIELNDFQKISLKTIISMLLDKVDFEKIKLVIKYLNDTGVCDFNDYSLKLVNLSKSDTQENIQEEGKIEEKQCDQKTVKQYIEKSNEFKPNNKQIINSKSIYKMTPNQMNQSNQDLTYKTNSIQTDSLVKNNNQHKNITNKTKLEYKQEKVSKLLKMIPSCIKNDEFKIVSLTTVIFLSLENNSYEKIKSIIDQLNNSDIKNFNYYVSEISKLNKSYC